MSWHLNDPVEMTLGVGSRARPCGGHVVAHAGPRGHHQFPTDALQSGTYFYRLTTGGWSAATRFKSWIVKVGVFGAAVPICQDYTYYLNALHEQWAAERLTR